MKMKMKMKTSLSTLHLTILLVLFVFQIEPSSSATVAEECNDEFTKVSPCLNYATGKSVSPSAECCTAVSEIKGKNPVCLCYIIEQTHDGQATLKQMGVQESRLIQLPSICKLTNASLSECPKLLKLTPTSPDAAIFTNTSSAVASNSTEAMSPPSTADLKSNGFKNGFQVAGPAIITAMAISIAMFPAGYIFSMV